MPGRACTRPINVPIIRSMCPPNRGVAGGQYSTRTPCCSQPNRRARARKSRPLSRCKVPGRPCMGQASRMPRDASQASLGSTACAMASATPAEEGASKATCSPSTQRVHTSSTSVSHGRPKGARVAASTSIRSTRVWSACTSWSGAVGRGPGRTGAKRWRAASGPSRARTISRSERADTRAARALREGGVSPAALQSRFTSRCSRARVGRSRCAWIAMIAHSTMASIPVGRRRAPLAGPGRCGTSEAATEFSR